MYNDVWRIPGATNTSMLQRSGCTWDAHISKQVQRSHAKCIRLLERIAVLVRTTIRAGKGEEDLGQGWWSGAPVCQGRG